ncbi:MAG TPA: nucleoside monophosphate kinase [Candidatus Saccharimonadales bacterium]|nr:nucleoside monophosphate kinase [Candidatus Saccharimonadales bacterium]
MRNHNIENTKLVARWLGTGSINIFGMPFAGKDTQGKKLAEIFHAPLLGGGDILRSDHMSERIKQLMTTGKLIPSDDYVSIVLPYLSREEFKDKPLILSSVGRWQGEEASVLEVTAAANHPLRVAVYLKLDEAIVGARWQIAHIQKDRGIRKDDAAHSLLIRLDEFYKKTVPVIDFYRNRGMLVEIDGQDSPDTVTDNILSSLAGYAKKS